MTGLTRNFRGSRSSAGSAGDSSSTCGEVGIPRFSFISENIVAAEQVPGPSYAAFGNPARTSTVTGRIHQTFLLREASGKLQKGGERLRHVTQSSVTLLLMTSSKAGCV